VRRVGGEPDERQALLIAQMVAVEWSALEAEATARTLSGRPQIDALKLGAEFRRQLLLLDRDLAWATRAREAAASAVPAISTSAKSLAEHLAGKAAAR
jgi:hypothetical protein